MRLRRTLLADRQSSHRRRRADLALLRPCRRRHRNRSRIACRLFPAVVTSFDPRHLETGITTIFPLSSSSWTRMAHFMMRASTLRSLVMMLLTPVKRWRLRPAPRSPSTKRHRNPLSLVTIIRSLGDRDWANRCHCKADRGGRVAPAKRLRRHCVPDGWCA